MLLAGEVPTSILQTDLTEDPNKVRNWRTHYGRGLTLDRIESVMRNANEGRMRGITELSRETMELNGHMSAVVTKRMNRVASGRICVSQASGDDIDEDRAQEYADLVRAQIKQIPDMRSRLIDIAWSAFDGRALLELDWNITGGASQWVVTDLNWVFPMRLSFDSHRQMRIVDERFDSPGFTDVGFPVEDVPWKFIVCKPRLFGETPEREGLARRCLYWTFFARFGTRERLILMELFGKPLRVARGFDKPDAPSYDNESIDAVQEIMDKLGGSSTAVMPFGFMMDAFFPAAGSGTVHADVIKHAEEQISKLCLGGTNTTDAAKGDGIGSGQAEVHQDAESLIIASDWGRIGDWLTHQLALPMVVVNHGVEAASYAPLVTIEPMEPRPDPNKETERLTRTLALGLKISVEEAYQRTGFRRPGDDEAYIYNVQGDGANGAPGSPVATIVYPPGEAPEAGELERKPAIAEIEGEEDVDGTSLELTPSDKAAIVSVNEARAADGLGPMTLPGGGPDPDGFLKVAEYKAKLEAKGAAQGTAEGEPEPDPNAPKPPVPPNQDPPSGSPVPVPPGNQPEPPPGNQPPPAPGKKKPTPPPAQ